MHTHEHDYVFYVLDGAPLQVFDGNGQDLGTLDAKTGAVFVLRCEGADLVGVHDPNIRVPATHAAKNTGATRYREILVETKH